MFAAAHVCARTAAPIHWGADPQSERLSELLFGERFVVRERQEGWAFGLGPDGTEGFLDAGALIVRPEPATHRVRRGVVQVFREPDLLQASGVLLPMNAVVQAAGRTVPIRFPSGEPGSIVAELASGGWVTEQGLAPIGEFEEDLKAVAMSLVGAAFLHGGRTLSGLDGPGLVHTVLAACGRSVPRRLDEQRDFVAEAGGELAVGGQPFSVLYAGQSCGFAFPDGSAVVASAEGMQVMRTTRNGFFLEEAGPKAAFDIAAA